MNRPNYDHRTFSGLTKKAEHFSEKDLTAFVHTTADKVNAIVMQMETQFINDADKLSDNLNFLTLETIQDQVKDIKTVVQWYFDEKKAEVK